MTPQPHIQIVAVTHDGQSARIASVLAGHLQEHGLTTTQHIFGPGQPQPVIDASAALLVLITAVRYGKHLPRTDIFLEQYSTMDAAPPLALVSVSLVARKPGRTTLETNQYLRKTVQRHALNPVAVTAFAGRLCYPKYGWLDRQVIRLIMRLTGGNTDGVSTIEYTDWAQVQSFAQALATLAQKAEHTHP